MEHILDIVVGDFGRPGTLRYLRAFSDLERDAISPGLPPGVPFMDEHRRVQLVVLCQLRHVKREILERFAAEGRAVDETVLVGTSFGPSTSEIVDRLGELLEQHARVARENGADRVRAVIPCNTLGTIGEALKENLQGRGSPAAEIEPAPMQPCVARALVRGGAERVLVLGTPGSVAAYQEAIATLGLPLDLDLAPRELVTAYESCIVAAIRGESGQGEALDRLRDASAVAAEAGIATLEACTDLSLGVGLDALDLYAAELVREAYPGFGSARPLTARR
jgi:aspartate/glutamate racemase